MNSNDILQLVNAHMAALPYDREPKNLYEPIRYVLSAGGKRIRPVLTLLSYGLFKDDVERALTAAGALETYHNYTLLHDDLMDNADLRRGRLTVHKKWDTNTAILSGDSMLVLAYEQMALSCTEQLPSVLQCFTQTALEVGEGQQYDMDFELRNDVSEQEYLEMIRLKTSVLLACAMRLGATLAGASADDQALAYKCGESLGLAFQLQDDFLDVYGDPATFGKAVGGDICNNKKTFMLIKALQLAEGDDRAQLERWLATDAPLDSPLGQEKFSCVREIYNKYGVDTLATQHIDNYFSQALAHLQALAVAPERKTVLTQYIHSMLGRQS